MTDKPYELLVHTTAPLARNEALYRSLASAYFEFITKHDTEVGDDAEDGGAEVEQDANMADQNAESQLLEELQQSQQPQSDTIQLRMFSNGSDSWTPDSQLKSSPKKTYLTRSRLATSSAAPPMTSQVSFTSTFTSALDGMNSPRFRMPPERSGPIYQWPSQTQLSCQSAFKSFEGSVHATPSLPAASQGQSEQFSVPPSTVPDSQSQFYNPIPAWSTSQVVMESFLAHFDSSHTTSSPSVRRSQRTNGTIGSCPPQQGPLSASSSRGTSNQSASMRLSLLDDGPSSSQVSPPQARQRQKQASSSNGQPVGSLKSTSLSNVQVSHQRSPALSRTDPVSPASSHGDEASVVTFPSPAAAHGAQESEYVWPQLDNRTPAQVSIPNRAVAAFISTPAQPDTPSRDLGKRRFTNISLQGCPSRPAKRVATHVSRIQAVSEVLQTPNGAAGPWNAALQVPFTGSFNIPVHQPSRVRNASFDEGISRISDTPQNVASSHKLPPPKLLTRASKPPPSLNTSISIVPDTPNPALNHISMPPPSSALPLPSAPPSSAITTSKQTQCTKRSSTHPHTAYEIHPPPPPTSQAPLTTFITPFLTKIADQMSYSRYDPVTVVRTLRKDERGFWQISLPDDVGGWNSKLRQETWSYLEKIVGKGRAGWGVHMYRALWEGNNSSNGKETNDERGWRGEQWRVYCWGEVVAQVYLLLFLASSRKVRGLGAGWVDAEGVEVVVMGDERRKKVEA